MNFVKLKSHIFVRLYFYPNMSPYQLYTVQVIKVAVPNKSSSGILSAFVAFVPVVPDFLSKRFFYMAQVGGGGEGKLRPYTYEPGTVFYYSFGLIVGTREYLNFPIT